MTNFIASPVSCATRRYDAGVSIGSTTAAAERPPQPKRYDAATAVKAALRRHGVRPGDGVGVLAGHTPEMTAALVGILGAGAAYIPIDLHAPAARVEDQCPAHRSTTR